MAAFEMSFEELQKYKGKTPKPEDFDDFWEDALGEHELSNLDYDVYPADFSAKGTKCQLLKFTGVGGATIQSKFIIPEEPSEKCKGILMFHGYRFHSGEWTEKLVYPLAQNAAILAMDVRGQAGGSIDSFEGGLETIYGHITRGVLEHDPQKLFYRNVYLDTVKAARILMSMGEIDKNRIGATGVSQGGGLAVACAALEPQIKKLCAFYPFLSDFRRMEDLDFASEAYIQLKQFFRMRDPRHEREDELYYKLGYIDIQNLAPRIRAEVLWFCGMSDHTCPPSTQFAAYNKITAQKRMILYPEYDHEKLHGAEDIRFKFFEEL